MTQPQPQPSPPTKDAIVIPPSPSSYPPGTQLISVHLISGDQVDFVNPTTYRTLVNPAALIRIGSAKAYKDFSPQTILYVDTVVVS